MAKVSYLEERTRCLKLVRSYRESIQMKIASIKLRHGVTSPSKDLYEMAENVINSLEDIERKISSPRGAHEQKEDFSLEEIARAGRLMAEQERNRNPFE